MAGDLYHAVGEWHPAEPTEKMQRAKVTGGRVSHVFFFPKKSLKLLEGKPEDWAKATRAGKDPYKRSK